MQYKSITFIGGGNMAQAIITGLVKTDYPTHQIYVCDRNAEKRALFAKQGINTGETTLSALENAEVIVLAIKPQSFVESCQFINHLDFSNKLIISIAAGISTQRIQELLPSATQIIRVMPNTPALVSSGMTGLYADAKVSQENKLFAQHLLGAIGETLWVPQEALMHHITAASGSSPAYFFLFMEAMQNMLVESGISAQDARLLVQQSALGSAKMVIENPDVSIADLRKNVTSKGGTTAAAIAVFEQQHLAQTVQQAMQACIKRSQEMEKLF